MKVIAIIYGVSILFFLLFRRDDLRQLENIMCRRDLTAVNSIIVHIAALVVIPLFTLVNIYYYVKIFVVWLMFIGSSND